MQNYYNKNKRGEYIMTKEIDSNADSVHTYLFNNLFNMLIVYNSGTSTENVRKSSL